MKATLSIQLLIVFVVGSLCCGCKSDAAAPAPTQVLKASTDAAISEQLPRDAAIDAYVQSMRDDLSRGKVGIITDVMKLNSDESKIFWPIYQEYEKELFALGDLRVEGIRRFAADQQAGVLDDTQAKKLGDAYFDFEAKRLELLKKYYNEIGKSLSPVRAAQFTQIEHRVGTVIDLIIAAQLPLIRSGSSGGT